MNDTFYIVYQLRSQMQQAPKIYGYALNLICLTSYPVLVF